MQSSVLGISPGTRQMGLAVFDYRDLIDFRIHRFAGKWSEAKQGSIIQRVLEYISQHRIEVIVLKTVHPLRTSIELQELIDALHVLFQNLQLPIYHFDIDELKDLIPSIGSKNKIALGEQLAQLYPELTNAVQKEKSNLNPYHEKLFEAVALAHIVSNKNRR